MIRSWWRIWARIGFRFDKERRRWRWRLDIGFESRSGTVRRSRRFDVSWRTRERSILSDRWCGSIERIVRGARRSAVQGRRSHSRSVITLREVHRHRFVA